MKIKSVVPFLVSTIRPVLNSVLRIMPSKVLVFHAKGAGALENTITVGGTGSNDDPIAGADSVALSTATSLQAATVTDLFTTPVSGVIPIVSTKTGSKWTHDCASLTPSNLVENLTGDPNRQHVSGWSELVELLNSGGGTGTADVGCLVVDQANNRACLIENGATPDGTSSATIEFIADEMVVQGQGFGEAA